MAEHPDEPSTATVDAMTTEDEPGQTSRRRMALRIAQRGLIMAIGIGIAIALLAWAFDDLDPSEVIDAVRSLDDAEIIALVCGAVVLVWAEALLTASVVEGLPARRGALAWLGPNSVASLVPGPSDMPVRYKMFVSWGYDSSTAGTAVAASGILNIGMKLVFPVVAAVGLAVADVPLGRVVSVLVTGLVVVGAFLAVIIAVVVSEKRTHAAGRFIEKITSATLRLFRRRTGRVEIAGWLVAQRAESIDLLQGRWPRAIASVVFVTVARVALLVMALRFVGLPEAAISWEEIFCVWAIQRGLTIVPIMPGGAGVTEFALAGLITAFAGSEYINQITAGVLIFRILTWLLLIPAGGAALGLWRLGLRRSSADSDRGNPDDGAQVLT
jgi:uncharacterized membrane protein YbhN (UPF0104 family)